MIGNGDADLATQSQAPPLGTGALNIRTGAGTDKAAFGNEVDFGGDPVSGLDTIAFDVYTTGENIDVSPTNLPNIGIEIDSNGPPLTPGDYSTFTNVPVAAGPGWSTQDISGGAFFLTGNAGTTAGCPLTPGTTTGPWLRSSRLSPMPPFSRSR